MASSKSKTPRSQASDISQIETLDQADTALAEIARLDRESEATQSELDAAISDLRLVYTDRLQPLAQRKVYLEQQLELFACTNRDKLMPGADKTIKLLHGELNFRKHPPAVEVRKKTKIADVIDNIKTRFRAIAATFIRIKEDLNRQEILTHASTLTGAQLRKFEDQLTLCGLAITRDVETFGYSIYTEDAQAKIEDIHRKEATP